MTRKLVQHTSLCIYQLLKPSSVRNVFRVSTFFKYRSVFQTNVYVLCCYLAWSKSNLIIYSRVREPIHLGVKNVSLRISMLVSFASCARRELPTHSEEKRHRVRVCSVCPVQSIDGRLHKCCVGIIPLKLTIHMRRRKLQMLLFTPTTGLISVCCSCRPQS